MTAASASNHNAHHNGNGAASGPDPNAPPTEIYFIPSSMEVADDPSLRPHFQYNPSIPQSEFEKEYYRIANIKSANLTELAGARS
ncbi:hypothetical protein HK102_004574, partial [Quaeritorhiza haematococci]